MADIGVSQPASATGEYLNDYFSKRSVLNLAGIGSQRRQKLMSCFQEAEKNGAVLYLDMAFAALTPDVISSYSQQILEVS
ncbi:Cytochrome P450 monooxygenase TRI4 [Metarhizium anisopliae]